MTDRIAELRPVQSVEMEVTDAARVELPAQLGGDGGSDQLTGSGQIVEAFEQLVEPIRDGRAALPRELARLGDVRHRQDSRYELDVDARGGRLILEPEERIRREEELGDCPVSAGIDLALEIVEVSLAAGRVRMDLWIGRYRQVERRYGLETGDQFGGIGIAARRGLVCLSGTPHGITAK